jgi:hypothetical protein
MQPLKRPWYQSPDGLLPVVAHAEDLHHANEDVDEVQLEADTLVDNITLHVAALGETGMVQDLLDIVEGEATEDGQTTVQPDTLRPHQGAGCGDGKNHGGKTGESDEGDTSEKGTSKVQIFLLLGGGANEGNRAHETDGVETSAGEQSRVVEH